MQRPFLALHESLERKIVLVYRRHFEVDILFLDLSALVYRVFGAVVL